MHAKVEPFEKQAKNYDEWFERNKPAYESELRAVKALLPERGHGVEIGAGTGRFAAPLGIRFGIEPASATAKIACGRGVEVVKGVAEALPLKNANFEFALMVTTICFLEDVQVSLEEARRVLKEGGRIVIGFIDKNSALGREYRKRKSKSAFYGGARFYSAEDVVSLLEKAGFGDFSFAQTIFRDLKDIKEVEPTKEGWGEGSFVVVKGVKRSA